MKPKFLQPSKKKKKASTTTPIILSREGQMLLAAWNCNDLFIPLSNLGREKIESLYRAIKNSLILFQRRSARTLPFCKTDVNLANGLAVAAANSLYRICGFLPPFGLPSTSFTSFYDFLESCQIGERGDEIHSLHWYIPSTPRREHASWDNGILIRLKEILIC